MAGLSIATSQQALDYLFPTNAATDYIAYSTDGLAETAILTRTQVGATGWSAATAVDPSVKQNAAALTSATATGAATITHFAVYPASSGGTQKVDWTPLATARTLAIGDSLSWAIGALKVTLT